jgi:putative peptidoglycan binding protein
MKIKQTITLIVGITSLAVTPLTWAAGHGGGGFGGGGGGHFGGGGFQGGGGLHGGGQVAGGVSTRGGGVGFGGMRGVGGARNFEGAGPRFSSFGHPSHVLPQLNHPRAQGSGPAIARQPDQRGLGVRNHIVTRQNANWHNDWDRRHAHFDHGRFFVFIDGFWCGLDAGYPWDYLPYYSNDYYPYDYYADTDPYDNSGATYNIGAADSATVQTVQSRLLNLGFYNGSIDGIFGPSTRDAVARFQIANQLNVTGSLSPDTLQSLGLPQATAS